MKTIKPKLRPAEGWPAGWYYSGEIETVNLEALLAPDEFFNRVILGRDRCNSGYSLDKKGEPLGASSVKPPITIGKRKAG